MKRDEVINFTEHPGRRFQTGLKFALDESCDAETVTISQR